MDPYYWAVIGVCITIGICALALVIFVLIFCRGRIQDDSNVRKRIITKQTFDKKEIVDEPEPEEPQIDPSAVRVPMPISLPPPPQPMYVPQPIPVPVMPQPPPLPPPEPRVIVREIIREREPQPQPQPQPVERIGRRRSWGGAEDDWVLVKKIKKRKGGRKTKSDDSDSSSSSSSSSSDDEDARPSKQRQAQLMPVRYGVQRLDPYDLAVPANPLYAARPAVSGVYGMVPAATANVVQPQVVVQAPPAVATAMVMPAAQPGYVSMMVPQRL